MTCTDATALALEISKGATFTKALTIEDNTGTAVDTTGWTFQSQVKTQAGALVETMTWTVVDHTLGSHTISLTYTETAALTETTPTTRLLWDFLATDDAGLRHRPPKGYVDVVDGVTDWT